MSEETRNGKDYLALGKFAHAFGYIMVCHNGLDEMFCHFNTQGKYKVHH